MAFSFLQNILISEKSQQILNYLEQPAQTRHPVSYSFDFLNSYRPNETTYLTSSIKKHLREIGFSGQENQPAGTFVRYMFTRLLIDLSWNSSRLEGNTYSLLETERLIQFGEFAEDKITTESQMILNHKAAIEFLIEPIIAGINKSTFLNLHAILSENLMKDPEAPGRLRSIPVGISGSVYHPLANPSLISEYFTQIIDTAAAINDPFEQSFFLMVHLPYLQPFEDVNKRVSRLAANIPLFGENLCPLSFVDVPEDFYMKGLLGIYELTEIELMRDVYVFAYERSSARYAAVRQTTGEPDPFKFKFRAQIKEIVVDIVRRQVVKKQATGVIKEYANQNIPLENQTQFLNVVETELVSLHEGNFARYGLKLPEFESWYRLWRKQ